jgi:uncharacterized protein YcfJ
MDGSVPARSDDIVAGTTIGVISGGVGTTIIGAYGSLVLSANGAWTYTLDNNPLTDALAQGAAVHRQGYAHRRRWPR